jgi:hypothetical protein
MWWKKLNRQKEGRTGGMRNVERKRNEAGKMKIHSLMIGT